MYKDKIRINNNWQYSCGGVPLNLIYIFINIYIYRQICLYDFSDLRKCLIFIPIDHKLRKKMYKMLI